MSGCGRVGTVSVPLPQGLLLRERTSGRTHLDTLIEGGEVLSMCYYDGARSSGDCMDMHPGYGIIVNELSIKLLDGSFGGHDERC